MKNKEKYIKIKYGQYMSNNIVILINNIDNKLIDYIQGNLIDANQSNDFFKYVKSKLRIYMHLDTPEFYVA